MNLQEIQDRVIRVVTETLGLESSPKRVTLESNFTEDFGADSLDLTDLMLHLEEEFTIAVLDEEADKITTVQKAVDYIADVLDISE